MEEAIFDSERVAGDERSDLEMDMAHPITESYWQNDISQGKRELLPPVVGMEFETYDDAYNLYNHYAIDFGFAVRVRNSWFRKKCKEKYHVVLCCSSEGFKKHTETDHFRPETRTGCPAMMRLRLVEDTKKWKVTEVNLEHNHLRFCKLGLGTKRKFQTESVVGVRANNVVESVGYENLTYPGSDVVNYVYKYKRMNFKEGDAQTIFSYFSRMQLRSPNFFYLMDVNDEGRLGNVFWADGMSRAAFNYFSDVVYFDTTYMTSEHDVPIFAILGLNHHGQSVLLGCGILADETVESFLWLFKAWLTCMLGRPPSVIITDQCMAMQTAVLEVFPRAYHCLSLWHIMQKFLQYLQDKCQQNEIISALNKAVYSSLKVNEFESAWEDMIQNYSLRHHEWLQTLYRERRQWVPVFLKEICFAGIFNTQDTERSNSYFDGYIFRNTSLKEFFVQCELALQNQRRKEVSADYESKHSNLVLKTKCCFEQQISKVYTKELFTKFQYEVEEMYSCFNTAQVHSDGPVTTYIVKERVKVRENTREIRDYEVIYNTDKVEVSCICGWFNFKGYLCRHALSVLNHNGMEEIPSQYILSRWKKDIKRTSVLNHVSNHVNVHDSLQRYDHLYKRAFHIVEEGTISREHYKVALEALEDSLNKICLVKDAESSTTTLRGEPCVSGNVSGHDPLQKEEVIQQTQIPWRYFIEKVCRDARKKIINDKRKGIETQGAELVNPRLQPIAPKPPYPGILVSTQEDSQAIDTQGAKLVNSRLRPISPKPPNPGKLVSTQEGLSQPVIGFGQYNPDRIVRKTLLTGAFRSSMGQSLELPCHSNLYRRLDTEAPRGSSTSQSTFRDRIRTELNNRPST